MRKKEFSLNTIKKIYFIGIKGVAMSGLAAICRDRGMEVMGSDVEKEFITDKVLRQEGIPCIEKFAAENLDWGPDLVVAGASWDNTHPEIAEAKKRKLPIISESELRGELSREKITIAVTGAHGKTTTTSLLAYVFAQAGLKPSYLVGTALIPDLGINGRWDDGKFFIVEGDEYIKSKDEPVPKFLDLEPDSAIITNIEWEHVDVYKSVKEMEKMFEKLIEKTHGCVVACSDWASVRNIIEKYKEKVVTYGNTMDAKWRLGSYAQKLYMSSFSVCKDNKIFDEFELRLLGRFNALNAIACLAIAQYYGIGIQTIKNAFKTFSGLERRMDTDEKKEITFVDDYGHHPTEVCETLHAIRDKYIKRNIICVFQPHTESRTMAFLEQFSKCFNEVDSVVLVDAFSSARENKTQEATRILCDRVSKRHPSVKYCGTIEEAAEYLLPIIRPRDVVVTMGAGDVYKVKRNLLENL